MPENCLIGEALKWAALERESHEALRDAITLLTIYLSIGGQKACSPLFEEASALQGGCAPQAETFYHKHAGLYFGNYGYKVSVRPDIYTLQCQGNNHRKKGYPQYDAMQGIIE